MPGGGVLRSWLAGARIAGVALGLAPGAAPLVAVAAEGPTVRVLLLSGSAPVRVEDGSGALAATIAPSGDGLRVAGAPGSAGRPAAAAWREAHDRLRFEAPGPWSVAGMRVRGAVEVRRSPAGLVVVNEVPLEGYVAGSVGLETPERFGVEALRAQAVAIRTYALHERARRAGAEWHVTATTSSQRYGGLEAETPGAARAARETAGEYLSHDGAPILAAFHASAGGTTEGAEHVWREARPYLQRVEIEGEERSPDTYWRARVSRAELARAAASLGAPVGGVRRLRVCERSPSGRARAVCLQGDRGEVRLDAVRLRSALGESRVKSTLFEVRPDPDGDRDGFVLVGSGRGHGVGMSQWGAYALARAGADYREILERFYPGATLERVARGLP